MPALRESSGAASHRVGFSSINGLRVAQAAVRRSRHQEVAVLMPDGAVVLMRIFGGRVEAAATIPAAVAK